MGYFVDFVTPKYTITEAGTIEKIEEGCCNHDIEHGSKRELVIHPIMHTLNVFGFILAITLILNYLLSSIDITSYIGGSRFLPTIAAAFIGLIPNCAISIGFTMMLIKGTITFGTAISGLLTNAGLGLLVLLKNNDSKMTR